MIIACVTGWSTIRITLLDVRVVGVGDGVSRPDKRGVHQSRMHGGALAEFPSG